MVLSETRCQTVGYRDGILGQGIAGGLMVVYGNF